MLAVVLDADDQEGNIDGDEGDGGNHKNPYLG